MAGRPRRESAANVLRRMECDPLRYLARRFNSALDGDKKDQLALKLIEYTHPKLKAVEHQAGEGATITVTIGGDPQLGKTSEPEPPPDE
ncbi:hypothetical protein [Shimia aestuarii]|uniref:Uncharacterized protein n=1 Tax=Shimia aestuarii TaxID=254406 RepID=A0A1I4HTX1_9RHOB|nr:hypothetical protein [Shimia aestuarii]SFL44876.1 hypothetical protein SAMN04488042_101238 [Shimia aestuarii]